MKKHHATGHDATFPPAGFKLYGRILSFARGYFLIFFLGVIANALYSGVDATMTYMLKPIVNKGFVARDAHFLVWLPLIIIALVFCRSIFNYFSTYFMALVSRSVVMNMRKTIFRHYLKIPAYYYDNNSTGELLSLMLYNVDQVARITSTAIIQVFQAIFLVLGLLVVMLSVSWKLTLIFCVIGPLMAVVIKISNRHMRRHNHGLQKGMGYVTNIAEESITGYREVRTFGGEPYEISRFDEAVKKNRSRELKLAVLQVVNTSGVQLLGSLALALVIYLATSHASTQISTGSFVALVAAMIALLKPLKQLTNVNNIFQAGFAGAQSIFRFLALETEHDTGTLSPSRIQGNIEFDIQSFVYPKTEKVVLRDIHFSVAAGKTCALVGRSGSGKTTLVSLLPRFYELAQGSDIKLDGQSVKAFTLSALREQVAVVSQHVGLFNDTIFHNVAYGVMREKTEAQVIEALKLAHAWEFIEPLPEGIHTLVGENGLLLSGGQRQRLAIARAILKDAPILILDEATSALDNESERLIQKAMDRLMVGRTTIVVAHRLSTIEKADQIMVMDAGELKEQGTHESLLAQGGYYRKLYDMQFQD